MRAGIFSFAMSGGHHKHCLLISSTLTLGGERVYANGVSGWDAGKQQLVTVTFFSNGVIEDIRYKTVSSGMLKGVYSVSTEGEPLRADCEVRAKQPDEWTFKSSVNVLAPENTEAFSLRFVRSEKEPKRDRSK